MVRTTPRRLRRQIRTRRAALAASLLALALMFGSGLAYQSAEPAQATSKSQAQAAFDKAASAKHRKYERKAHRATSSVKKLRGDLAAAAPQPAPEPAPVTAPAPASPSTGTGTGTGTSSYPLHTRIPATTFWVGEIFDANASDGSQMLSTYDGDWFANYGGCDGVSVGGSCETEPRVAANGFFPTSITPKQNPFYLDLPYDDVNDRTGFANRGSVIPWANEPAYAGQVDDQSVSLMKNRWVKLMKDGQTCYGQIADAGPGEYHDADYVFGSGDARPANTRYGGAGMDVSPALNGCLNFSELDGEGDLVDWQFVEYEDVPAGPWLTVHSNDNHVIN